MPDNLRRKNYPFCGRLIILESRGSRPLFDKSALNNYEGMVAINFPSMPETIELARNTEYKVGHNPAFPDGIHQYLGTFPLELPIKFTLHSFDRVYCPQGALSLLQLAAELQALTLPFGGTDIIVQVGPNAQAPANLVKDGTPASKRPDGSDNAVVKTADEESSLTGQLLDQNYDIYPPATCYLELIVTDRTSPGVACIGYVSKASVTLKGPWMRGPGISQNLPTSADFSFTFIHHPGHGNAYNIGHGPFQQSTERQAFAQTVRDRLFNTRALLTETNYHGWGDERK
jgi:hypothetical protein